MAPSSVARMRAASVSFSAACCSPSALDNLCTANSFGFSLFSNCAYHGLVQINMFDFDIGNLNTPSIGLRVDNILNILIELVPFRQHFVEFVFTEH